MFNCTATILSCCVYVDYLSVCLFVDRFITVVVISAVVFLVLLACAISVITCFCCALCRHDSKTPTTHTILTTGYIPVPRDGVINMNNNTNKTHTWMLHDSLYMCVYISLTYCVCTDVYCYIGMIICRCSYNYQWLPSCYIIRKFTWWLLGSARDDYVKRRGANYIPTLITENLQPVAQSSIVGKYIPPSMTLFSILRKDN